MSDIADILSRVPVDQIADRLGVDRATAEEAVRQALPALVGGMGANAQDPAGAASLAAALGQHDPALVEGGVNLADVDAADGERIVGHVFGRNTDQVVSHLGGLGGATVTSDLMAKLLPLLAPIVMSYLAKRLTGGAAGGGAVADVLGQVLGGLLGPGAPRGTGTPHADGPSLGGIDLGSVLGGLGGLLGGGRR